MTDVFWSVFGSGAACFGMLILVLRMLSSKAENIKKNLEEGIKQISKDNSKLTEKYHSMDKRIIKVEAQGDEFCRKLAELKTDILKRIEKIESDKQPHRDKLYRQMESYDERLERIQSLLEK